MSEERIRELIGRFASEDLEDKRQAEEELECIGSSTVPYLIEALSDPDVRIREWAAHSLRYQDDRSVTIALINALSDEDPRVRRYAAWSLGRNEDNQAIEPLIEAYKDADASVRTAAIHALGGFEDERVYDTLESALQDPDSDVRGAAVMSMRKVDHPHWIDAVLSALNDEDCTYRFEAITTVAFYQRTEQDSDPRLIQPLIRALDDDYYLVRVTAIRALGSLGVSDIADKLTTMLRSDPHPRVRERAADVLGELGIKRAIEPLHEALSDEASNVQVAAAGALRNLGEKVDPLFELSALDSEDWTVRIEALRAIGESNDPRAIDALIGALKDESHRVRLEAAWALGKMNDERAIEPLIDTLGDPNKMVRHFALTSLWKFDDPRIEEPIIGLLNDPDDFIREQAAIHLGYICSKRAVAPLINIVREQPDSYLRANAAGALGSIQDQQGHAVLMEALTKQDLCVVAGAYDFFIRKGAPGSEEMLIQALNMYGCIRMARDFAESGNNLLAEAGRKWIEEHPDELREYNEAVDAMDTGDEEDEPLKWGSAQS